MRIGINALFLQQPATGTGQHLYNLLQGLDQHDKENTYVLLSPRFRRAAVPRFISAFNSGNADALSSFYADDAVLLLPNAPVARGAAGVRQAFMSMSGARPTLDFAPDRINVCGDMATEVGHYTMSADRGNYVAVWRRQSDGTWKMTADSVVSTVPMSMSH